LINTLFIPPHIKFLQLNLYRCVDRHIRLVDKGFLILGWIKLIWKKQLEHIMTVWIFYLVSWSALPKPLWTVYSNQRICIFFFSFFLSGLVNRMMPNHDGRIGSIRTSAREIGFWRILSFKRFVIINRSCWNYYLDLINKTHLKTCLGSATASKTAYYWKTWTLRAKNGCLKWQ